MRMRKKKYLNERLDAVKGLILDTDRDERDFEKAIQIKEYFDFEEVFGNSNPVRLEIGCGKGQFIYEIALKNPYINYLAVEKSSNVIVTACQKSAELPNVRFLKCGAEYLSKYIENDSIERIYLNFSCPFPKKAYASHRLTAPHFLKIYDKQT